MIIMLNRRNYHMNTWSLNELYKDFDQSYFDDVKTLENLIKQLNTDAQNLTDCASLENWITTSSQLRTIATNLFAYTNLRMAANTLDSDANRYYGQLLNITSEASRADAIFTKWISSQSSNFPTWIQKSSLVNEHQFILQEIIDKAHYALSEDVEEALSKMQINGSSAWSQLHSHLTSTTTIEFEGKNHTLTSLRNLAYSSDAELRKKAYQKELELYALIDDSVAYALNSIKGEVIQTNSLRGYETALTETLIDSRMSQKTLDALIQAIENALPDFRRYLNHKAKLMGHTQGLPWYDMFAPYETQESRKYTIEEAHDLIVNNFANFSEDLATMADNAFKNQWIDFLPREGKVGGAFCYNLPTIKQSRILTNFGGSISDIVTLAHELGHAYHGMMLENNAILNTDYTMPVAETASTFCENIIFNASLIEASDEEKIVLIENSLQDLVQITVDILSRFKFEDAVFNQRAHDFLDSEALQSIMKQAQKETYGDGLDENTYNPFMWVCKGHYYSAGNNYYNFPYAFGGLFALGLYAQFEEENEAFVEKYRELLKTTAVASCEDVAKVANVDTTDVTFWEKSIQQIIDRIDLYIELTSK